MNKQEILVKKILQTLEIDSITDNQRTEIITIINDFEYDNAEKTYWICYILNVASSKFRRYLFNLLESQEH